MGARRLSQHQEAVGSFHFHWQVNFALLVYIFGMSHIYDSFTTMYAPHNSLFRIVFTEGAQCGA